MKILFLLFTTLFFAIVLYANPMVLVFDTSLSGSTTIALPLYGTVDVTVNWGDGNTDTYTSEGDKSHTYANEGTYTVSITGILTQFGNGEHDYPGCEDLIQVNDFGDLGLTSLKGAFFLLVI